jgi:hypothetical protein
MFVSASAQRNWPVPGLPAAGIPGCRTGLLDGDPAVRQVDTVQLAARDDAELGEDIPRWYWIVGGLRSSWGTDLWGGQPVAC